MLFYASCLLKSQNQSLSSLGSANAFKVKVSFSVLLNFLDSRLCLLLGLNILYFLVKSSIDLRYFYISPRMFRVTINVLFLSMILFVFIRLSKFSFSSSIWNFYILCFKNLTCIFDIKSKTIYISFYF